ncbi:MAG: hypothetical protein IT172_05215 [Acidobacteria bacterium]|nr:hypothetical protein [Acidobacteriota bacterium]
MTKQKIRNTVMALLVLGTLIPSTGCQAASDLFNPDTYNFYNTEPWERNRTRKVVKPKTMRDQM